MQRWAMTRKLVTTLALVAGTLLVAGNARPQSELTGTWHSFAWRDHPSGNDPEFRFGTIEIDAEGDVIGGSNTDRDGTTVPHTGGSFTTSASGSVEGSIVNMNGTDAFAGHQLDVSGTLIVGVDNDPDGNRALEVAIKQGGSFATADLEGTWRYLSLWDQAAPGFNNPGWDRLQLDVDELGVVTSTAGFDSQGGGVNLDGIEITIDAAGVVGIPSYPAAHLKMTANKQVILGVLEDDDGFVTGLGLVREGGGFQLTDLEGRWHYYTVFDGTDRNRPNWARGRIDLDAAGEVVSGTYELNGSSLAIEPGAGGFGITLGGTIGGQLHFEGSNSILSFKDLRLNLDKNFVLGGYGNATNRILMMWVLPEPSSTALACYALLAIATACNLRRRPLDSHMIAGSRNASSKPIPQPDTAPRAPK